MDGHENAQRALRYILLEFAKHPFEYKAMAEYDMDNPGKEPAVALFFPDRPKAGQFDLRAGLKSFRRRVETIARETRMTVGEVKSIIFSHVSENLELAVSYKQDYLEFEENADIHSKAVGRKEKIEAVKKMAHTQILLLGRAFGTLESQKTLFRKMDLPFPKELQERLSKIESLGSLKAQALQEKFMHARRLLSKMEEREKQGRPGKKRFPKKP